jgi:hypothetical protein
MVPPFVVSPSVFSPAGLDDIIVLIHCVKCDILQAEIGRNLLGILCITGDSKQLSGWNAGGAGVSRSAGLTRITSKIHKDYRVF